MTLKLYGLKEIPLVQKGDNIAEIIEEDLEKEDIALEDGDILLIAETLISKAEGNIIKIDDIVPSDEAIEVAEKCKKDPKIVEIILRQSNEVVAVGPNFIVTETKHGFVCANSGIDESNVEDGLATPIPENPDQSAKEIREYLEERTNKKLAVIITDTQGRAFMGQANEGIPVVLIRGFTAFDHLRDTETGIKPLLRPKEFDVFRK